PVGARVFNRRNTQADQWPNLGGGPGQGNMTLRILHLSDLHLDHRNSFDQRVLVDALIDDVEHRQGDVGFDLIIFSGDLAATGKATEFDAGRRNLLDRLTEVTGLGPDRVVLVPGNHDVDRAAIDDDYEAGLRS